MTQSTPKTAKTALIIGASRGLGLAITAEYIKRGWQVIATERRTESSGLPALKEKAAGQLTIETLDINNQTEAVTLKSRLGSMSLDLLFINAGIANGALDRVGAVSNDDFMHMMMTNALSPMRLVESLENLVPADGTIGVMSSELGSVSGNDAGGWEVYRASKAALNTFLRSFAVRDPGDSRTYLVMSPGWVRTDMGGPEAPLSIEESMPQFVDTVISQTGKGGVHYLDYRGKTVPW